MVNEQLSTNDDFIEIGTRRYRFSQETQQYLSRYHTSTYPKHTSVIIGTEPHYSSEGQFNLFKGLEAFFASNPKLVKQTIFLSEGTAANKSISVQELIKEEPHPSDEVIRQVLQTFMITGYMAYEWKYQYDIPIIGTEDEGLYSLSQRFASLCLEKPDATFITRKYIDETEFNVPLLWAWKVVIDARNKRIAQTLIEQSKHYKNPMLFTAWDHVVNNNGEDEDALFKWIKGIFDEVQHMGVLGAIAFPWNSAGENWHLHHNFKSDAENFDINHYLRQVKMGYTYLQAKGDENVSHADLENYKRLFRGQRER